MKATEFLAGALLSVGLLYVLSNLIPTKHWYEYLSIKPTKEVYIVGEPLKLISTVINKKNKNLEIEWHDELRCISNGQDLLIDSSVSKGSLFENKGLPNKTVWKWGIVPKDIPMDVPCYIRSLQTIKVLFNIERKELYESSYFKVSEFDYTKQQQKG